MKKSSESSAWLSIGFQAASLLGFLIDKWELFAFCALTSVLMMLICVAINANNNKTVVNNTFNLPPADIVSSASDLIGKDVTEKLVSINKYKM